jgi:hypothetical protein
MGENTAEAVATSLCQKGRDDELRKRINIGGRTKEHIPCGGSCNIDGGGQGECVCAFEGESVCVPQKGDLLYDGFYAAACGYRSDDDSEYIS